MPDKIWLIRVAAYPFPDKDLSFDPAAKRLNVLFYFAGEINPDVVSLTIITNLILIIRKLGIVSSSCRKNKASRLSAPWKKHKSDQICSKCCLGANMDST